jgi:hypothetical protein
MGNSFFESVEKAKEFIVNVNPNDISPEFSTYEAEVQYSNGDVIRVEYHKGTSKNFSF